MRLPSLNIQVVTALVLAAGPMFAWSFNATDSGEFAAAAAAAKALSAEQDAVDAAGRLDLSTVTLEQAQGRLLLWTGVKPADSAGVTDAEPDSGTNPAAVVKARHAWTITPIALSAASITSITSGPGTTDRVSVGVRANGAAGTGMIKVLTGERLALTYRSPNFPLATSEAGTRDSGLWKLSGYQAVSQSENPEVANLRTTGDGWFSGEYDS